MEATLLIASAIAQIREEALLASSQHNGHFEFFESTVDKRFGILYLSLLANEVFPFSSSFRSDHGRRVGALGGNGGTREADGTVAEILVGPRSTRQRTVACSIG